MGRHGGGGVHGKDPTKVDRSAAYMSRHNCENIVCGKAGGPFFGEVQLAYAIGVAEPVSVARGYVWHGESRSPKFFRI